ncbi:hypothetical protein OIV83_005306 [Microbotryomycetes sp. JL201]|nr:hypothetical protein OIV83_005306 [Microbotryomycetes sp. JL201]
MAVAPHATHVLTARVSLLSTSSGVAAGAGAAGVGALQPIAEEAPATCHHSHSPPSSAASSIMLADRSNMVPRKTSIRRKPAPPLPDESVAPQRHLQTAEQQGQKKSGTIHQKTSKKPQRSSEDAALFSEAKSLLDNLAYKVFGELGCVPQANKSLWKLAMTLATIGHDSSKAHKYEEALNMYSEARALFRHIGERPKEAMALYQSGLVYVSLREHEQAMLLIKEAGRLFAEVGDESNEAMCMCETANVMKRRDAPAAIEYFKHALLIYLRTRDSFREAKTLYAIGALASTQKNYAEAFAYLQQARVIFRQRGDSINVANCSYQLGKLYNRAQELELSVGCFEDASQCYRACGRLVDEGWCYYRLGLAMLKANDRSTAADYLTEARTLFKMTDERQAEASCLMRLGEIIRHVDKDGAKQCWEQVVALIGKDKNEDRRVRRVSMWLDKLEFDEDTTMSSPTMWESPMTDSGFEQVADDNDHRRYRQQELEDDAAWWNSNKAH